MWEYMPEFNVFSELHQTPPCPIIDVKFSEMNETSHRQDFCRKKSIYRFHPEEKILDEYEEDNLKEQCV